MASFLSGLVNQFGGDAVNAVAGRLGIGPDAAQKAFGMAAPAALAAMAGQASTGDGAAGLMRTLGGMAGGGAGAAGLGSLLAGVVTGGGGGGLGQMLGGLLRDPAAMEQGVSMAKNLFGTRMGAVEAGLARETGVKADAMGSLLGMAVPAVMGSIAGLVKSKGFDVAGMTSFLDGEVASLAKAQPDVMGSIGGLLGGVTEGPGLVAGLVTSFGAPVLAALGARLGLPEGTVKGLAPVIIGLVVAALARKMKQPDGLAQIGSLIGAADRAGLGAGGVADHVRTADPRKHATMVQDLIGGNSLENVAANLGRKTGISAEAAAGLLGVAAPLVLGQIGRLQKQTGADTRALAGMLGEDSRGLANLGDVDYVLDDTPGITDDIARGLKKLFGG